MTSPAGKRRRTLVVALGAALLLVTFARNAGNILVVSDPQRADVILVLAGETYERPTRALDLLDHGYGRRVLIDVPATARVYGFSQIQLAEKYVRDLPQAASVGICPIQGLSTKLESRDVEKCLAHEPVVRVLIVTSDFHTRRALSIFRHELKGKSFSVAAVHDDEQFGTRWWTRRQWAKTCFEEWLRLFWWNVIERWH
ncbi:MAG TPA: ElyC/SanA/YdcF family protein [Candidatus Dormibacteraeota bacterium]|nr:ElyC/SanA/YdcF family protein [Candidatus Dormibacteraeota bacterium]